MSSFLVNLDTIISSEFGIITDPTITGAMMTLLMLVLAVVISIVEPLYSTSDFVEATLVLQILPFATIFSTTHGMLFLV
jgi:hypothetical protein